MGRADDIRARIATGLTGIVNIRKGQVVPESEDISPSEGVELNATYVYADMAGSSKLVHSVYRHVAAKIVRTYVNTASMILKAWDGEIRSFDGDRVMGIFIGENRNRVAVRAAMEINWSVHQAMWPKIQSTWNDTATWGWSLGHGVGIDTGEALLIRAGVRGDNDIVSIGNAPNVAAKLSELRGRGSLYITEGVFNDLNNELRYGKQRGEMWSKLFERQSIGGIQYVVYGSDWYWDLG
jgi:adenylate cyclase